MAGGEQETTPVPCFATPVPLKDAALYRRGWRFVSSARLRWCVAFDDFGKASVQPELMTPPFLLW